jgi:succinylglutamate desuccinylase
MSAESSPLPLRELDHLPAGFLDADPAALSALLGGPALIHLPGRRAPALFVSILLHGNEHTGLRAVQRLLAHAGTRALPRALSILVGNVEAARAGLRRLDGQPDWNRVWPGSAEPDGPERAFADAVVRRMRERGVFAVVDVHNNTGRNPHYGCVTRLDAHTLSLAALFARIAVHFETTPRGTLSAAFASVAPSIAIECGRSGEPANDARAAEYLEACLHLSDWPSHAPVPHDLELFRTLCTLRVRDGVDFAFAPADATLVLDADLDALNFRELAAGAPLGRVRPGAPMPLVAIDDAGRDVAPEVLALDADGVLRLARPLMPAMLTLDARVIRQDCVGYLMARLARR